MYQHAEYTFPSIMGRSSRSWSLLEQGAVRDTMVAVELRKEGQTTPVVDSQTRYSKHRETAQGESHVGWAMSFTCASA
jgi:hypothetical protein